MTNPFRSRPHACTRESCSHTVFRKDPEHEGLPCFAVQTPFPPAPFRPEDGWKKLCRRRQKQCPKYKISLFRGDGREGRGEGGGGGGGAGARFIVYWTRCSATALVDTPLAAAWSREILPLYPLIDSVSRSCRGGDEKRRSFLVAFALLRGASLFDVACSFLSLVVRQGSRLPTEATLLLSAACG